MPKLINYHIAVLDFCSGSVNFYQVPFKQDVSTEDVRSWLENNTDYRENSCEFMFSSKEIPVNYINVE